MAVDADWKRLIEAQLADLRAEVETIRDGWDDYRSFKSWLLGIAAVVGAVVGFAAKTIAKVVLAGISH